MLSLALMINNTPKNISPEIEKLCGEIVPSQVPVFLDIETETDMVPLDCFVNIQKKKEKDGGSIQYGWKIWEWSKIMIEAEFHAVWVSPQNHFVDITPEHGDISRILFCQIKLGNTKGSKLIT